MFGAAHAVASDDSSLRKAQLSWRDLFVDNGSGDGSLKELRLIQVEFPAVVTIIELTRNFGQAGALLAGYGHARGKCAVTLIGGHLWRTLTQVRRRDMYLIDAIYERHDAG